MSFQLHKERLEKKFRNNLQLKCIFKSQKSTSQDEYGFADYGFNTPNSVSFLAVAELWWSNSVSWFQLAISSLVQSEVTELFLFSDNSPKLAQLWVMHCFWQGTAPSNLLGLGLSCRFGYFAIRCLEAKRVTHPRAKMFEILWGCGLREAHPCLCLHLEAFWSRLGSRLMLTFSQRLKNYQYNSIERQKRSQNLAPVLVIL